MTVQSFEVERTIPADRETVWRLLGDSSTWPGWTPIDRHVTIVPGGEDGVGEVRMFETGRRRILEEIVDRREGERLSYELRAGLAVRDYRAVIDLESVLGGETRIQWRTSFKPDVPGLGRLYRRGLEKATKGFVDGLAAAAKDEARRPGRFAAAEPSAT